MDMTEDYSVVLIMSVHSTSRLTHIRRYKLAQFDRVMRKGVAADGHNLYPGDAVPMVCEAESGLAEFDESSNGKTISALPHDSTLAIP
ncbi:hypothetical protein [Paraburkholderia adhaesiva]|uniref:hypothetical protein n=1 Tax=Paraburkholderia adhaesiva TaxID=2883244 RepID=UPI001F373172|nr:hypothetical protein [Paraburkholderia adhaesiva]